MKNIQNKMIMTKKRREIEIMMNKIMKKINKMVYIMKMKKIIIFKMILKIMKMKMEMTLIMKK